MWHASFVQRPNKHGTCLVLFDGTKQARKLGNVTDRAQYRSIYYKSWHVQQSGWVPFSSDSVERLRWCDLVFIKLLVYSCCNME